MKNETQPELTASNILDFLRPEKIEENIFRAHFLDLGSGRAFGGFVMGQALYAAYQTIDDDRLCHSLHSYFILPGDANYKILYDVERTRDGRSFVTRSVDGIQYGKRIFKMTASFHREEKGLEHQMDAIEAPDPESLLSMVDYYRELGAGGNHKAAAMAERLALRPWPLEVRMVDPQDPFNPQPREPKMQAWFKVHGETRDSPRARQCILAGISDYGFLGGALLPHGKSFQEGISLAASLDHSIWYHRDFDLSEWMLFSIDSPMSYGARGFVRGSIFDRQGVLVASVAQEGLLRLPRVPR